MLGIGLSSLVLQISGYKPNVEQTTETLRAIRLFFGPIPLATLLIAVPLLIWYPITRKTHAELLARLEAI